MAWAPELPSEAAKSFAARDPARAHAAADRASFTVATRGGDTTAESNVDPAAWCQGLGSSLIEHLAGRIARLHGVARPEVRSSSRRAAAFCERRGRIEHRRCPGTECGSPVEILELGKPLGA